jgi:hypothetical protein
MSDGVLAGLLSLATTVVLLAAGIALALNGRAITARAHALLRRLGLLPPPPPRPSGMQVERIARDLRRLHGQVRHREGDPVARHRGVVAAYDEALVDACRALGITTDLGSLPGGIDRDAERLRVETEVERAGIELGPD